MSFNPKDKTVSVYLSKHNYSKAIKKKKGIISLLFLKSSAELINIEDPSDIDGEEDGLDGEEIEIPVISNPSGEGGTVQEAINFNDHLTKFNEHLTTYASSEQYGHVKIQGCNENSDYIKLKDGVLIFENSFISTMNNNNTNLSKLTTKVNNIETNLSKITTKVNNLNSKIENIETDLSKLTTKVSNLATKVNNLIDRVDNYHPE